MDDDDELPAIPDARESKLSVQLGEQGLRAIDTTLLNQARLSWLKVARVVHDAVGSSGYSIADDIVQVHVRRIGELVTSGMLEAQGNLRRPRFSEVRLPGK